MDLWAGATTATAVDALVPLVRRAMALEAASAENSEGLQTPQPESDIEIVHAAMLHQLSALLATYSEKLGLDVGRSAALQAEASSETLSAMSLVRDTESVWEALSACGMDVVAFKGVALSMASTGSAVSRGSGDIDLLVDEGEVLAACNALGELGYAPESFTSDFISHNWRWLRWSTRELNFDGPKSTVDLHWRISQETGLFDPTEVILNRAVDLALPDGSVRTLGEDDTLLAACYSFQHDSFRSLRQAVDLIRLLRKRTAPVPYQGRALAMASEAAAFVDWLLGGLPATHLTALGFVDSDITRAQKLWAKNKHDPRTREPMPSMLRQANRARGTYGYAPISVELARLATLRLLTRRGERALRNQL